jgi:hypothetical protein
MSHSDTQRPGFPALIHEVNFEIIEQCLLARANSPAIKNNLAEYAIAADGLLQWRYLTGRKITKDASGKYFYFSGELRDPIGLLKKAIIVCRLAHGLREMMSAPLTNDNAARYLELKDAVDLALDEVMPISHPWLFDNCGDHSEAQAHNLPRDGASPSPATTLSGDAESARPSEVDAKNSPLLIPAGDSEFCGYCGSDIALMPNIFFRLSCDAVYCSAHCRERAILADGARLSPAVVGGTS